MERDSGRASAGSFLRHLPALLKVQAFCLIAMKNVDRFLFERHISQKIRRSGGRTAGPKKRTRADDESFEAALREMLMTPSEAKRL